jgi:transcriptional regulator with XRE-family HTH domain
MEETRLILKSNIKKYRNALKHDGIDYCKSTKKFAAYIGIEPTTYKKYETMSENTVPPVETLVKIASALHISIDKLLNYEALSETPAQFLSRIDIDYKKETDIFSGKTKYVLSSKDLQNDLNFSVRIKSFFYEEEFNDLYSETMLSAREDLNFALGLWFLRIVDNKHLPYSEKAKERNKEQMSSDLKSVFAMENTAYKSVLKMENSALELLAQLEKHKKRNAKKGGDK